MGYIMSRITDRKARKNFRAWLEALRSGEYQQAKAQLKFKGDDGSEKFCCLGVACELSGRGRWASKPSMLRLIDFHDDTGASDSATMTTAVMDWLGVEDSNPEVTLREDFAGAGSKGERVPVAELNDAGMSFPEIADLLEREYL